jgi:hypothetical protein
MKAGNISQSKANGWGISMSSYDTWKRTIEEEEPEPEEEELEEEPDQEYEWEMDYFDRSYEKGDVE